MLMLIRRAFASVASAASQTAKTRIQPFGEEVNYASALYVTSCDKKSLDTVERDLQKVNDLYASNTEFKEFVLHPYLNHRQKIVVVESFLKKVGVSEEVQEFCECLAEDEMLNNLQVVIDSFEILMRAHRGEAVIDVVLTQKLSPSKLTEIIEHAKKLAKPGKKLTITSHFRPSMFYGTLIIINGRLYKPPDGLDEADV